MLAGYGREEEESSKLQCRTMQTYLCVFLVPPVCFPTEFAHKTREKESQCSVKCKRDGSIARKRGLVGKKAELRRAFSRDHSPKTAGDVDAHKTTNPRHKHTKKAKRKPPPPTRSHTRTHVSGKWNVAKCYNAISPLFCFFFILATNPNSIVEGKIAKKASLENWHSRNEQQQTSRC